MSTHTFAVDPPCCCGGAPPGDGTCALLIPMDPGFPPPAVYPDYATARDVLNTKVAACSVYYFAPAFVGPPLTFTATITPPHAYNFSLSENSGLTRFWQFLTHLDFAAATSLSIAWSISSQLGSGFTVNAELYSVPENVFVVGNSFSFGSPPGFPVTGTLPVSGIPAGQYVLYFWVSRGGNPTNFSITATFTCPHTMIVGPVRALWNDGGTVRQTEACPKLLLPEATEVSGSWFASIADANTFLNDYTRQCVFFAYEFMLPDAPAEPVPPDPPERDGYWGDFTLTYTDAGVSVGIVGGQAGIEAQFMVCFEVEAGAVLNFNWYVNRYDLEPHPNNGPVQLQESGACIQITSADFSPSLGGCDVASRDDPPYNAPPWVPNPRSGTLGPYAFPAAGRYYVRFGLQAETVFRDYYEGTNEIVISGGSKICFIQALYDVGLDCPARLDCTP